LLMWEAQAAIQSVRPWRFGWFPTRAGGYFAARNVINIFQQPAALGGGLRARRSGHNRSSKDSLPRKWRRHTVH